MKSDRTELKALNSPIFKWCEGFLFRNWWVLVILILCLILYEQGVNSYKDQQVYLSTRMEDLVQEKQLLRQQQEDIRLQIYSQSDPDWIELTLMRVLGVVPDGQKKMYFQKSSIE